MVPGGPCGLSFSGLHKVCSVAINLVMNTNDIATAREISDRRMNYLASRGERERNTIAWRDAVDERNYIERRAAFSAWAAGK